MAMKLVINELRDTTSVLNKGDLLCLASAAAMRAMAVKIGRKAPAKKAQ